MATFRASHGSPWLPGHFRGIFHAPLPCSVAVCAKQPAEHHPVKVDTTKCSWAVFGAFLTSASFSSYRSLEYLRYLTVELAFDGRKCVVFNVLPVAKFACPGTRTRLASGMGHFFLVINVNGDFLKSRL